MDWHDLGAILATLMGMLVVGYLVLALLLIVPTWRILDRAGFAGALSLLNLVPLIGPFLVLAILAFSTWPAGEAAPPPRRLAP